MDDLVKVGNSLIGVASPSNVVHDETLTGNGVTTPLSVVSNETVLWEGEAQDNITLSENALNFEYIKVEWCPYTEASNWCNPLDVVITKVNDGKINFFGFGMSNDASYQIQTNVFFNINTVMTLYKKSTITISPNSSATSNLNGYKIFKVIGIGRKGGN